jgi:hypothetical protein
MMLSGTSGHNRMLRVERPKAVETGAWAAGNGDRSENGDYIYSKLRLWKASRWSTRDSRSGATRYSSARRSAMPLTTGPKTQSRSLLDAGGGADFDVSPSRAFISARAIGDTQLTWPRAKSASSMPTLEVLEIRYAAADGETC